MSDDLHFSSNHRDLSQQYGTGSGFQFEFYCQSCSDTWRSPFAPYRSGQASGWVREIGNFASNLLGGLGSGLTMRSTDWPKPVGAVRATKHSRKPLRRPRHTSTAAPGATTTYATAAGARTAAFARPVRPTSPRKCRRRVIRANSMPPWRTRASMARDKPDRSMLPPRSSSCARNAAAKRAAASSARIVDFASLRRTNAARATPSFPPAADSAPSVENAPARHWPRPDGNPGTCRATGAHGTLVVLPPSPSPTKRW